MNKFTKILLITAGGCIVTGLVITGIAIGLSKKNGKNGVNTYEKVSVNITDSIENIDISEVSHDIRIEKSSDDKITVEYWDNDAMTHEVKTDNNTLTISYKNSDHWYDYINVGFNFTESIDETDHDTVIYLPEGVYNDLTINAVSSDISIPDGYTFSDVSFNTVSGEISCASESTGNVKVNTTSGNLNEMYINGISAEINTVSGDVTLSESSLSGSVVIDTTSGKITLTNITVGACDINTTSGDIVMNNYSADRTTVNTTSGDITASVSGTYNIDYESVSGDSNITCDDISDGALFNVETISGDLTVSAA